MTMPWHTKVEAREYRLYNPGDAFMYEYATETFKFPAHDQHWVDPVSGQAYPEPGVMPVRPRGHQIAYDFSFKPPREVRVKNEPTEVIQYFIGDDGKSGHLGMVRGIRILSEDHNAEADAATKAEARQAYLKGRYERAQLNTARHEAMNVQKRAKGEPEVPANRLILDDYRFIAQYESLVSSTLPKYPCPKCSVRFVNLTGEQSLDQHIDELHPSLREQLKAEAGIVVKRKRGRPRKNQAAAA